MDDKTKDFWDKVDIVLRPVNGILAAVAVAILGYYTSSVLRQSELHDTNQRVYTELMSSREQAESGLRKDMFLSVIQSFMKPEGAGLEAKMLNLEMLAYNFHESLNLKPLFDHMDRQISASQGSEKKAYTDRLDRVAREVSSRQLLLLQQVGPKFDRTIDYDKFKASPGGLELELDNIDREFMISVLQYNPERRELTLEMGIRTPKDSSGVQRRTFHVGYYDFPMIDNTRLSWDQRAAIVLNQMNEGSADLTLVYFPGSYASLREKVSYDEVVEKLRLINNQPK
jgi:hypothetical protein